MPYIAVKSYPKDEETKKKVAEEINQIFLKYWKCPPQAISISLLSKIYAIQHRGLNQ